jgi:hypothetical protein
MREDDGLWLKVIMWFVKENDGLWLEVIGWLLVYDNEYKGKMKVYV